MTVGESNVNSRTAKRGLSRRTVVRLVILSAVVVLLHIKGCNWAADALSPDAGLPPAARALKGGTDVTFFVAADTHFGHEGIDELNKRQIAAMNALPGTSLPPNVGGTVREPRGVLICGDLTNNGRKDQWRQFVGHYGLSGRDALLKYPVYECTGNHDREPILFESVLDGVRERHGSLIYSWDWDDVHFVCLDLYPSAANVRWLRKDLAKVGKKAPVIIYFHYPLSGPFSDWWTDAERRVFREAIDGCNVIAMFHGHYHGSMHYTWEGYDVYNVGSPRHGHHSFATVHITDGRMTVASWQWDRAAWRWSHSKIVNR